MKKKQKNNHDWNFAEYFCVGLGTAMCLGILALIIEWLYQTLLFISQNYKFFTILFFVLFAIYLLGRIVVCILPMLIEKRKK